MVQRRDLVGGGLVGGLAALMTPSAEASAPADDREQVEAIDRLRETFQRQFDLIYPIKWNGVSRVRKQQHTWMASTRKYPDFIEVGLDVWDNVYDWHVAYQQPVNMMRLSDGRYTMTFMFTTLLLRPDQDPDFVSYPFDADGQGRAR
jgi:hypothetical protein